MAATVGDGAVIFDRVPRETPIRRCALRERRRRCRRLRSSAVLAKPCSLVAADKINGSHRDDDCAAERAVRRVQPPAEMQTLYASCGTSQGSTDKKMVAVAICARRSRTAATLRLRHGRGAVDDRCPAGSAVLTVKSRSGSSNPLSLSSARVRWPPPGCFVPILDQVQRFDRSRAERAPPAPHRWPTARDSTPPRSVGHRQFSA